MKCLRNLDALRVAMAAMLAISAVKLWTKGNAH